MSAIRSDSFGSQSVALQGVTEQFAVTPKTTPSDLAKVLGGNDVIAARKALKSLNAEERAQAFTTPIGENKLAPVLDAARRGAPHMVALYAGMGAALNGPTSRGLTALHEALFGLQLPTVRTMLANPALREALIDRKRVELHDIHALIDDLPANASEDVLNAATLKVTESNLKLLEVTDRLAIYHAHVYDKNDSPLILNPKGWHPESALEQRTRTLIGMAVTSEHGSELRHALVKEIAITIEALHLERRAYTATNIGDAGLAKEAIAHEVDGIMARVETAIANNNPERRPFLIPVGTALHQMYMEIEPCYVGPGELPHILIHFDNRGAGSEAHTKAADGSLYAIRSVIPVDPSDPHTPRMKAELRNLLTELLAQRAKGTVESVYQAIYGWMTTMTTELGVDAIEDPSRRELAWRAQVAGNCTIANLQPSTARRLGKFADAFFDFELTDIVRRIEESVSRAKLRGPAPARGQKFAPIEN